MLDKKEKMVMSYLCEICKDKKTYLISVEQIASQVYKKCLLSVSDLDDIMISLSKDNYLDFVAMDGRKGYYYCITLKNKGLTYKKDIQKEKKEVIFIILRTVGLAVLSFVIGFLLKMIFKG